MASHRQSTGVVSYVAKTQNLKLEYARALTYWKQNYQPIVEEVTTGISNEAPGTKLHGPRPNIAGTLIEADLRRFLSVGHARIYELQKQLDLERSASAKHIYLMISAYREQERERREQLKQKKEGVTLTEEEQEHMWQQREKALLHALVAEEVCRLFLDVTIFFSYM